jgi:glycine C-acetyltransferase
MFTTYRQQFADELDAIRDAGTFKNERIITSPQRAAISVPQGEVINFCANNYLGLADNPEIIDAAKAALDERGFGMASVRFICGTQDLHKRLEQTISKFNGTEDTILYSSCFDANAGLFETILGPEDAIISDELNHASIIDGVRLCKAKRFRYSNSDMGDLEAQLKAAADCRRRLIATDGVFHGRLPGQAAGDLRPGREVRRHGHGGRLSRHRIHRPHGPRYRRTPRVRRARGHRHVHPGQGAGRRLWRLHHRTGRDCRHAAPAFAPLPVFDTLTPSLTAAAIRTFEMLTETTALRDKVMANTRHFRAGMAELGFDLLDGETAIVPVMLYDAKLASDFADAMLTEGIYVIGFSYPVVPQGKARIRVQISAAHETEHLDRAIAAFRAVGTRMGVI